MLLHQKNFVFLECKEFLNQFVMIGVAATRFLQQDTLLQTDIVVRDVVAVYFVIDVIDGRREVTIAIPDDLDGNQFLAGDEVDTGAILLRIALDLE